MGLVACYLYQEDSAAEVEIASSGPRFEVRDVEARRRGRVAASWNF